MLDSGHIAKQDKIPAFMRLMFWGHRETKQLIAWTNSASSEGGKCSEESETELGGIDCSEGVNIHRMVRKDLNEEVIIELK